MIKLLHIENIAVIERCDIEFNKGFNVLTGETGAGKSIIIDSIGAVLGYRTTRDIVRSGAQKASVTAVFDGVTSEISSWISENSFDCDDENLIIQRDILSDGKSSARINGKPATASLLKNLGILLINILGQHDSQLLLNPESHALFIDRFSSCNEYDETVEEYRKVFDELNKKEAERKSIDMDESAKARQIEMLSFQIDELESANLRENEDNELYERQKIMRESAKISERISEAHIAFSGDDGFDGITSALYKASHALSSVGNISEKLSALSDSTSELYYSAEDIASELRDMLEGLDFSEQDANEVESRLDLIHRLKRKYGGSVAEMLKYLDNARSELESIELSGERIAVLDKEISQLKEKAQSLAQKLFEFRKSSALEFESLVMRELRELDMPNAKFIADVQRTEEFNERGNDRIEFLLAPNLGEAEKPLERIASGGELSRVMLALKNVLAKDDYVETLIFDEIDTGVSGRAAQKIAEKLYKLSITKQVLCVTHLAQISAMSDTHFKIEKKEHDGRTFTSVTALDDNGRAEELARITGGSKISATTIKNAEEMLELAQKAKAALKK